MAFIKKKLTKEQRDIRAMKAKLPLAKPSRRKLEDKTAQQLIPEADKWFSRMIRLRDSEIINGEWVGNCISSGRRIVVIDSEGKWQAGANNGHFISRGVYSLRFNELNCNLQGAWENAWQDKEAMLEGYRRGIADKYGEDTLTELKELSKAPDAYKRPTKPELLEIIRASKEYVKERLA